MQQANPQAAAEAIAARLNGSLMGACAPPSLTASQVAVWGAPLPVRPWFALLSSRPAPRFDVVGRGWRDRLRWAIAELAQRRAALLFDRDGPCAPWIRRAAERARLSTIELELTRRAKQFSQRQRVAGGEAIPCVTRLMIERAAHRRTRSDASPLRREQLTSEQLLLRLSDRSIVLHVRSAGNLEHALEELRSRHPAWLDDVTICGGPNEPAAARWVAEGLGGRWFPEPVWQQPKRLAGLLTAASPSIAPLPADCFWLTDWINRHRTAWPFLIHCTRGRRGPWPDQSTNEYLDEVLEERAGHTFDPMTTLLRIVEQGRLIASGRWVRGGQPVVSFSATPLDRLLADRQYRRHLRRWDYEPFGVGLSRERLMELGGRPVTYLEGSNRQSDGVYEQPAASRSGQIDWRGEQEWRIARDVVLADFQPDHIWLFVPDVRAAETIRAAGVAARLVVVGQPAAEAKSGCG